MNGRWPTRATVLFGAVCCLGAAAVVTAVLWRPAGDAGGLGHSAADHLRTIETTRLQALVDADTATARRLMAPDFQVINPSGGVSSRQDYLDAIHGGAIDYLVFKATSPVAVRLSGDAAALRYQASFDMIVAGDTRVTHGGWITELYERRHARWQIVWEQATAVPNDLEDFVESIKPVN